MRIEADQERCIGAGQCVMTAPALFDQRESDGIVEVLEPVPGAGDLPAAREAVGLCPAAAITLHED